MYKLLGKIITFIVVSFIIVSISGSGCFHKPSPPSETAKIYYPIKYKAFVGNTVSSLNSAKYDDGEYHITTNGMIIPYVEGIFSYFEFNVPENVKIFRLRMKLAWIGMSSLHIDIEYTDHTEESCTNLHKSNQPDKEPILVSCAVNQNKTIYKVRFSAGEAFDYLFTLKIDYIHAVRLPDTGIVPIDDAV